MGLKPWGQNGLSNGDKWGLSKEDTLGKGKGNKIWPEQGRQKRAKARGTKYGLSKENKRGLRKGSKMAL